MGGAVLVRALELQHDLAGAIEFEPFMGDGGACDRVAQLFKFVALIEGAAHLGVEAEPLLVGTALWRVLRIKAGDGLQSQHFLTRSGPQRNAVGAGRRLQGCQGAIFATLSLLRLLSSQHFLCWRSRFYASLSLLRLKSSLAIPSKAFEAPLPASHPIPALTRIGFGPVSHALLFNQIALACQ